jgi:hypothetical protein
MNIESANVILRQMVANLKTTLRNAKRLEASDEAIAALQTAITEFEEAIVVNENFITGNC